MNSALLTIFEVRLRGVQEQDLPIFYEQQLDPEATRQAAFPARGHSEFMAHWKKILTARTGVLKTILFKESVAGNIVCWEQSGDRNVGYWLGRNFWGKGIGTASLSLFLNEVTFRPLQARAVKHNIASIRVLQKCGFTITGEDEFIGSGGEVVAEFILTLTAQTMTNL